MATPIKNEEAEGRLRDWLTGQGYDLSPPLKQGETGVDILAIRGDEKLHVEVIGFKKNGPSRARDFFEVFFRAVSRLNDGATKCVIALPDGFEKGMPQRARQYAVAWKRIGKAFPELYIWLVNADTGAVRETHWRDWVCGDT